MRISRSIPILATLLLSAATVAQERPGPKNLQVLPEGTPLKKVQGIMRQFALDVRCTYCHAPDAEDPNKMDFASDAKDKKKTARLMMQMTQAINNQHIVSASHHGVEVTCATCHHDNHVPVQLQSTLENRIADAGVDSAVIAYQNLREKHYGRAVYDFGENILVEVGNGLAKANDHAGALKFYQLNLTHFPESVYTRVQTGQAFAALGDTTSALSHLEKALEIQPKSRWVQGQIKRLKN